MNSNINRRLILLIAFLFALALIEGCASSKYMLDDPVNDPIMYCDDQEDSDLVKVEDGGGGAAGGGCPT